MAHVSVAEQKFLVCFPHADGGWCRIVYFHYLHINMLVCKDKPDLDPVTFPGWVLLVILDSRARSSVWEREREVLERRQLEKCGGFFSSKETKQCKHPSKIVDFRFWGHSDIQVEGSESSKEA